MMLRFTPIIIGVSALLFVSCDKINEVFEKAKEIAEGEGEGEEEKASISHEELVASDAAVAKVLDVMEKVPGILAKVKDVDSAFAARKQLDLISPELAEAMQGVKVQDGSSDARVETLWYTLDNNEKQYDARSEELVKNLNRQLKRIALATKGSAAYSVVEDGIMDLFAFIDPDRLGAKGSSAETIKPMPKNWLPPGVTPG